MAKTFGGIKKTMRSNTRRLFVARNFGRKAMQNVTDKELDELNVLFSNAYINAGVTPDTDRLEVNSRGINLIDRKNLEFDITYDDRDQSMKHDLFLIHNEAMRGNGLSKKVYKALLPIYDKIGVKKIRIHAGDENGGYTWARYGFRTSYGEVSSVLGKIRNEKLYEKAQKIVDKFYSTHERTVKFPMNLISDEKWGKDALKGSKWFGEIDLTDAEQRNRYVSYINSR